MSTTDDVRALLIGTATELFTDHCGPEVVDAGWSPPLWRRLEDTGLTLVSVPEPAGGAGAGLEELGALLRVAGYFAAPVPLAETAMLAGWLLATAGLPVPSGPLTAADGTALAVRHAGDGRRLTGRLERVPWARAAHRLVLLAGPTVLTVDPAACSIASGTNLAGEPRDTVDLDDVPAVEAGGVGVAPEALARELLLRGALARALLMAGVADRALELTVRHAGERVQFGRPIGRFQAVQRHLAELAGEVTATGVAAEAAARAFQRAGAAARTEVAAAKQRASEAAGRVAALAHQVHGAIGFTEEHVLRHATTRLWSWRDEYGNEAHWSAEIGREVLTAGPDRLWPLVAGG